MEIMYEALGGPEPLNEVLYAIHVKVFGHAFARASSTYHFRNVCIMPTQVVIAACERDKYVGKRRLKTKSWK